MPLDAPTEHTLTVRIPRLQEPAVVAIAKNTSNKQLTEMLSGAASARLVRATGSAASSVVRVGGACLEESEDHS